MSELGMALMAPFFFVILGGLIYLLVVMVSKLIDLAQDEPGMAYFVAFIASTILAVIGCIVNVVDKKAAAKNIAPITTNVEANK